MLDNAEFIYCADAGLGSYNIRKFNSMGGRAFIVTQSIKKLSDVLKKAVFNDYDYHLLSDDSTVTISSMKTFDRYLQENRTLYNDFAYKVIIADKAVDLGLYELADRVQNIEKQKRILLRKLDRSRRDCNPNNYNKDGTIKKQGNKKVNWIKSNHYIKTQNQLKELYRKQADIRKLQHEILANEILSQGDNIYVETMNYAGLQKRAKKTEKNDKGKFKKKKRFGKSLANKAPAMLLSIIDRKLKYYNRQLIKIDTYSVKASQYNHFDETYKKKKLSDRWNDFNGIKVQRDMYSAFLIMNVNPDLKSINKQQCDKTFNKFLTLHNKEVDRLRGNKNLSSIAI